MLPEVTPFGRLEVASLYSWSVKYSSSFSSSATTRNTLKSSQNNVVFSSVIVEEGPLPQTAVDTLESQIHSIEAIEILFRNPAPITPTANATTKQVQM